MEQADLDLIKRINRLLLDQTFAAATSKFNPTLIAIGGMLAGATSFVLLLAMFEWMGV